MTLRDSFPTMLPAAGSLAERERKVLFLLLPQVNLLDLAGPAQVFYAAADLGMSYKLLFCAVQTELASAQGLVFARLQPLMRVEAGDMVLVPGFPVQHDIHLEPVVSRWLQEAYSAGAHIASVCTGAFILGEAGLLDGRRCTTHWGVVADLQAQYPRAQVLDTALFVHDGRITTSAGIASGIDMALSLLEQQHGPLFTAQVARFLVVYLRRNGSQSQDSMYLQYRTHLDPAVHRVQDHLISHLSEVVSLSALAEIGHMSTRSMSRAFKDATGLTLVQYHQRLQLELATTLLNNPELSIEEVATKCGFEDPRHFRRLWHRQFGVSPSEQRKKSKTSNRKEQRT